MKPFRLFVFLLSVLIGLGALVYAGTGTLFFVSLAEAVQDAEDGLGSQSLTKLGVLRSAELKEVSGIARSGIYADSFWCHNDSGHSPKLYLVRQDGEVLAECAISGAQNADWEDISSFSYGGVPYLAIGDVGDNRRRRENVAVYLLREPKIELKSDERVKCQAKPLHKLLLKYEDGPRDCEALGVAGETGELLLIEKRQQDRTSQKAGVYRLDLKPFLSSKSGQKKRGAIKLPRIAEFPIRNVTGMAFSQDSQKIIARDYLAAHLIELQPGNGWGLQLKRSAPKLVALPLERQGEAICFDATGAAVITTSEFQGQPIWQVTLKDTLEKKPDRPNRSETDQ